MPGRATDTARIHPAKDVGTGIDVVVLPAIPERRRRVGSWRIRSASVLVPGGQIGLKRLDTIDPGTGLENQDLEPPLRQAPGNQGARHPRADDDYIGAEGFTHGRRSRSSTSGGLVVQSPNSPHVPGALA